MLLDPLAPDLTHPETERLIVDEAQKSVTPLLLGSGKKAALVCNDQLAIHSHRGCDNGQAACPL